MIIENSITWNSSLYLIINESKQDGMDSITLTGKLSRQSQQKKKLRKIHSTNEYVILSSLLDLHHTLLIWI